MYQSSYFKSRPDLLTFGGVGGGNFGKHLEWRNRDEAWGIEFDVTVLDSLSLGKLGEGVL